MFSTLLQEIKVYFGRDFMLAVFFPILFFVSASLALFLEISQGWSAALVEWEKTPLLTQMLALASVLVLVTLFALIIYNFQFVISRLFEGYWARVPILRWLRNPRVNLYRRRYDYLSSLARTAGTVTLTNEIVAEQLKFYPPPNHLDKMMPTRFGNVLRGTEIYAYDRYGIDPSIIWTRLRPLLSPETLAALENKKTAVDFSLTITMLAAAFALIWCPLLAIFTNRWGLFLICSSGSILAWLSYQNAVQSALAYGEQIISIFDLYRHSLLEALKRPLPDSANEERKEWLRLTRFFYRNVPLESVVVAPKQSDGWQRLGDLLADYFETVISSNSSRKEGPEE